MRSPAPLRAPSKAPRLVTVALALVLGACGGGQTRGTPFDMDWVDDHGAAMRAFARSFRGTRVPRGADVAVGVLGKEGLVGVPLDGGAPWAFAHVLHGRPALAGSVVVAAGGGEVFALEAKTGKLLWKRTSGGRIRGAGDDGVTTVVSLLPTTGFGSLILAVNHEGSVIRQLEDTSDIGAPAVVGDAVFFPWKEHYLSVYDLLTGDETARVALPGRVNRVFSTDGALFLGERAVTRFDEHLAEGAEATTVRLPAPLADLPFAPVWQRPGADWTSREADAFDKSRLYARPSATGTAAIYGERIVATYFRAALGFDASSGALAWAHAHDADFLGGAAYQGGVALCDAKGVVTFLDLRTGGVAGSASLGKPVDACLVQADALVKPPAKAQGTLPDQIAGVLSDPKTPDALKETLKRLGGAAPRATRAPAGAASEG